jgi:hypothetical protein
MALRSRRVPSLGSGWSNTTYTGVFTFLRETQKGEGGKSRITS